jgi:hypothetical protein
MQPFSKTKILAVPASGQVFISFYLHNIFNIKINAILKNSTHGHRTISSSFDLCGFDTWLLT